MLTHTLPLSLPTQTHHPFFSTLLLFHTDFYSNFICPATFHFSCQNLNVFLSSPTLFCRLALLWACIFCLLSLWWTFSLSFSHLCFFLSALSLRSVLWLCESQISASSGCRLHQQLPSLTPYFTFSLPLLFIPFLLTSPLTLCYNVKCITLNNVTLLHFKNVLNPGECSVCNHWIHVCSKLQIGP